ncbi:chromatin remodelling complex Rsc7/Swp82 subunit-domain-containing protein [Phyllosticta paracitricarpa]|uniref:Chromatin remodelling complex Rsc7/Swp82 subunit-domain-containing protein n=1 Tax=Phyllosticta citricarpa TaxID=55181 RepID=A0ABR1LDU6_9PEZI
MYSTTSHHPVSASLNGGVGNIMDPTTTINPAALNSAGMLPGSTNLAPHASPRGIKRSRSPDASEDVLSADRGDDDDKPKKRGRPPKTSRISESPSTHPHLHHHQPAPGPVQTPQLKSQSLPQTSPSASSPPKSTPTKGTVLKALPTVRDHTTDQLNPEGDEYIPREFDEAGEKKVTPNGHPLDGREFRCRTFFVPNRGNKLFMLATECARVLGYRDSYLLFNKNRSLYKIIATQAEKDDLIHQEILPYSYRSRQIAIVTARSMFRQFGSRLIVNGRRVRDDYWESKARKQGFTEEDAAGEKRPGAARQREAAAAEANNAHALTALPHGEIIYSNGPAQLDVPPGVNPTTLAPLPMINLAPVEELRARDFGGLQRPRHEISGPAYEGRMQPSTAAEILNQAAHAADFNKGLGQQRGIRSNYMDDYWKRPHEPVLANHQRQPAEGEGVQPIQQGVQSPRPAPTSGLGPPSIPSHSQPPAQMMTPQAYSQPSHAQSNLVQTPMRPMHQPQQLHHRSPSMNMGPGSGPAQPSPYGYPQNQMWPPPQAAPSPLSQTHHNMPQFGQSQSPHPQPSPMHAPPPQLHHSQSSGSMHGGAGGPMGYSTMSGMNPAAYSSMGRNPYQPSPSPAQHFGIHQSSAAAQQPGMQGWASGPPQQQQPPAPQQNWQGF